MTIRLRSCSSSKAWSRAFSATKLPGLFLCGSYLRSELYQDSRASITSAASPMEMRRQRRSCQSTHVDDAPGGFRQLKYAAKVSSLSLTNRRSEHGRQKPRLAGARPQWPLSMLNGSETEDALPVHSQEHASSSFTLWRTPSFVKSLLIAVILLRRSVSEFIVGPIQSAGWRA